MESLIADSFLFVICYLVICGNKNIGIPLRFLGEKIHLYIFSKRRILCVLRGRNTSACFFWRSRPHTNPYRRFAHACISIMHVGIWKRRCFFFLLTFYWVRHSRAIDLSFPKIWTLRKASGVGRYSCVPSQIQEISMRLTYWYISTILTISEFRRKMRLDSRDEVNCVWTSSCICCLV